MKLRDIFSLLADWEYKEDRHRFELPLCLFLSYLAYYCWRLYFIRITPNLDAGMVSSLLGAEAVLIGCMSGFCAYAFGHIVTRKKSLFANLAVDARTKLRLILRGGLTMLIPLQIVEYLLITALNRGIPAFDNNILHWVFSLGGALYVFFLTIPSFFLKDEEKRFFFHLLLVILTMLWSAAVVAIEVEKSIPDYIPQNVMPSRFYYLFGETGSLPLSTAFLVAFAALLIVVLAAWFLSLRFERAAKK